MRVGIISFSHESNTFSVVPTTWKDFEIGILATGPEVEKVFDGSHHEVAGFFEELRRHDIEPVGIFASKARPQGMVTAETYDRMVREIEEALGEAGSLDGLLLAPHGAGVAEGHPDMDGDWLTRLRDLVGDGTPIICTLDPHANLSPAMIEACTVTIAFQTNPHIDHKERGLEAARLMAQTLQGQIRPTQAAVMPPIAINIERQLTREEPCQTLIRRADEIRARPGVLSVSFLLGYPYADIPVMGTSFVVATDNDPEAAERQARELADLIWDERERFRGEMISIEDALARAGTAEKPVLLLDMGDNAGGGSPSDGTLLAEAILHHDNLSAFVALRDEESVQQAFQAGVGAELQMAMGAKADHRHGRPLELTVRVEHLSDGAFDDPEPRHGGLTHYEMGPTAVVKPLDRRLTIMLTTRKTSSASPYQLYSNNLDPKDFDVIVAKGVHAPVAGYADLCPTRIRVNTPGVTSADMESFDFQHRRRPLFPFESLSREQWEAGLTLARGK